MKSNFCSWPVSHADYFTFQVCELNVRVPETVRGNYIFAKLNGDRWDAVYIGEGIISERIAAHLNEGDVIKKGATHIHLIQIEDGVRRKNLETSLLQFSPEAYAPKGCNIKKGG